MLSSVILWVVLLSGNQWLANALQKYIFQPEYGALPPEEKRALLEEGFCPGSVALQDCSDLKMNFAMDWNLLRPALETAFYNMTQQRIRILDGVESQ